MFSYGEPVAEWGIHSPDRAEPVSGRRLFRKNCLIFLRNSETRFSLLKYTNMGVKWTNTGGVQAL